MAKAKMKPPLTLIGFKIYILFTLVSVVYAQLNLGFGIQREVFFLKLEDGYFGCQVNSSSQVLQLFELSKLCDGTPNCYLGSDENVNQLKCTNTCPYTQGKSCVNGACLDGLCHCNDGYGGCGCEELDENECKYRPCDVFAYCKNTLGSFSCTCFPGYQGDGLTCKDIDECQDPAIAAQCVENAWCCNLPAHYTCKCNSGYTGDGYKQCTDINECAKPNACGANAICNNLPGNYTCTCPNGYMGNPYDGCVDMDECSSRESVCGPQARCSNREGGFECSCPRGYEGDPYSRNGCTEINECIRNPCANGAICHDGVNNFTCSCPPGFYGDPYQSTGQCLDVDECQTNPCGTNAQCTDNIGSYTCSCSLGFTGDPYIGCRDIDECSTLANACGPNAICRNMIPGHECSCPQGYDPNPTAKEGCEQVTVGVLCSSNFDCVNNAICQNGQCFCREGFQSVGASCLDVDECQYSPCGPDAQCRNIPGSFSCSCNIGFIGHPPDTKCKAPCDGVECGPYATCQPEGEEAVCICEDGWTMDVSRGGCVDTNECDITYGPYGLCGAHAICSNAPGAFECTCPPGFTGNAKSQCIDIDECRRPSCGYGAVCTNTLGSYTCECPLGTVAEPDAYTECLEIMKCGGDDDCPGNAMCLANQCMCPEPNIGDDCRHPCEDISCGPNAECKLINGIAKCLCENGFNGIPTSGSGCVDVNECHNNPCQSGAICRNLMGTFTCECPTGFEGDPMREGCVEIRSPGCSETRPCPLGEECLLDDAVRENVCVCRRGYVRGDDGNCRDVNECIETRGKPTCGMNAICKNLPGSYDCQCPSGFVGNPFSSCTKCETLECTCQPPYKIVDKKCVLADCSSASMCPVGAECVTIQGGVSYCACQQGYTTLKDGSCQDVDECYSREPDGSPPCGLNAICNNKIGSYECICPSLRSGDPYKTGCALDPVKCGGDDDCRNNEKCVQPGKCVCSPPYFIDNQDGNRCKSPCDAFPCGINSKCSPTDPPTCICQPGFASNGLNGCSDIDECRTNPCSHGAVCVNEIGTYKCECPANTQGEPYKKGCERVSSGPFDCKRDIDCPSEFKCNVNNGKCINPCDDLPCGRNAYCEVQAHVRFCKCLAGYTEGQNGECVSMCDGFLCGQNAKCIVANDGPTCKCEENYKGNPFPGGSCDPDRCSSSNPCSDPQVCVNARCKERCESVVCGVGAKCDKLTNKCMCLPHFLGDPNLLCVPPVTPPLCTPGCGPNAHCEYGQPNTCICNAGYSGNPYERCVSQIERATCETTKCGTNAKCREGTNRVDCVCPVGYKGNPYVLCEDVDECIGNACGNNAKCINTIGSFDCRCQEAFTGNPFMMCMRIMDDPCEINPELCACTSDSSCSLGFTCQSGRCVDTCENVICGPNAACLDGVCRCNSGFTGNPKDQNNGCQVALCKNNLDCEDNEICFSQYGHRICVDACQKVECGPNSKCVAQSHRSSCLCLENYVQNPNDPIGGCQIQGKESICQRNSDCPSGQVCKIDQYGLRGCTDPCVGFTCDQNEICSSKGERPICDCRSGYIRNPNTKECQKPGIPDCATDFDCSDSSTCNADELGVLKCVDSCIGFTCGLHSFCEAYYHRGQCQCKEGFTGNPNDRSGCRPIPKDECKTDSQCPETHVCKLEGGERKCVAICRDITCGPNAVCIAKNHAAQCQCPPGLFVGDPNDSANGCYSVSCLINEDCPFNQACNRMNYQCFDVCFDACGENAICIPENHRYNCKCPPGSKPNPSAEISCSTVNLCEPNPCHPTAQCTETRGSYSCSCPTGMRGDAYSTGCYEKGTCPNGDSDCPQDSVCVNNRCVSPCENACGMNTQCIVRNRKPNCTCLTGFTASNIPEEGCRRDAIECTNDAQCFGGVCLHGQCNPVCRRNNECAEDEKCIENMCKIPCISSNQCPSDQACISSVCIVGCRSNSECPTNKACINNKCEDPCSKQSVCGPNANCRSEGHQALCDCPEGFKAAFPSAQHGCVRLSFPCESERDCPAGTFCDNGVCMARCKQNKECAQGETCTSGMCMKVCFNDGNCLQGEVCISGSCVPGCRTKTDCLSNEVCLSNKCHCTKGYMPGLNGCVDVDECKQNPCDSSADCINVPGSFKCSCPSGTVRDPLGKACLTPNECNNDNDCPGSQACTTDVNGIKKCIDSCGSAVCGGNAVCRVQARKPVCECRPGHYGDPSDLTVGCVSGECLVDGDCQPNRICDSQTYKCIDPCLLIDCRYGRCQTTNHKPSCVCEKGFQVNQDTGTCIDINECTDTPCHRTATCVNSVGSYTCQCPGNYIGEPYSSGCRPPGSCNTHNDCPSSSACIQNRCVNPCLSKTCGKNAKCEVSNHVAKCICPPLFAGDPDISCDRMECDDERSFCKPGFNCMNNKCVNICDIPGSCGKNAECNYRRDQQTCTCKPGYTGDPTLGCTLVSTCVSETDCPSGEQCRGGICVALCSSNRECLWGQVCISGSCVPTCKTSQECPDYQVCQNNICMPEVKCQRNTDCDNKEQCRENKLGQAECQPVCNSLVLCGRNAECIADSHEAICQCPDDYYGDPMDEKIGCRKIECDEDNDCDTMETCINHQCRVACHVRNDCGENALCQSENHKAVCFCRSGFTGDPLEKCVAIDFCQNEPCGPEADCHNSRGTFRCTCPRGTVGDPYKSGCERPVGYCDNDSECPATAYCSKDSNGRRCKDVCEQKKCGTNAECKAINHRSVCRCRSGYEGDADSFCRPEVVKCRITADCPPNTICDGNLCRPPCQNDAECSLNESCTKGQCTNICDQKSVCGLNSDCNVVNHQKQCSCPAGFTGDPLVECYRMPSACISSNECNRGYMCESGVCTAACKSDKLCALNEKCIKGMCLLTCRLDHDCFLGHICLNNICLIGCRANEDCGAAEGCINSQCVDPCKSGTCGPNAECRVANHRAQCFCPSGFISHPTPNVACVREPASCEVNSDCKNGFVCSYGNCVAICSSTENCLSNEQCDGSMCRPICSNDDDCRSGEICQSAMCVAGCRANSECPLNEGCINKQCVDPCQSPSACGNNAECKVQNHQAICTCPVGYIGDANVRCRLPPTTCSTLNDCPNGMTCIGGNCKPRCRSDQSCSDNERCIAGVCKEICSSNSQCGKGHICVGRICIEGCRSDSSCPSDQACINRKCRDPCKGGTACGYCANCETVNHRPQCQCPENMIGNPLKSCDAPQTTCSNTEQCKNGDVCDSGYCFGRCDENDNCACGEKCSAGFCRPECDSNNQCKQGFLCNRGICVAGCRTNSNCPRDKECINSKCEDPCKADPCGKNAECKATDHRSICICPNGYNGDAYVECLEYECLADNDCTFDKTCRNGKCESPCITNACGENAQCHASQHKAQCSCPPDYYGNPSVECKRDVDECLRDPCANNAYCTNTIGSFKCTCNTGCQGDPFLSGCLCPQNQLSCNNYPCGIKAKCREISGNPECYCPRPFPVGNPDKQCFKDCSHTGCGTRASCRNRECVCDDGWNGNPYVECFPGEKIECRRNEDCSDSKTCAEGKCVNPCLADSPCPPNKKCTVVNHQPVCICEKECSPSVFICLNDKACPTSQACIGYQCDDPCKTHVCPGDSPCYVQDHQPLCKFCPPGYTVEENYGCVPASGCTSNSDCPTNQACINELCKNPCVAANPCNPDDDCKVEGHTAVCIAVGCRTNSQCPSKEACINKQCVSPCAIYEPCEAPEECEVRNHEAYCFSSCTCSSNRDCETGYECDGCTCRQDPLSKTICNPPCRADEDCDEYRGVCVPTDTATPRTPEVECIRDSQCGSTETCLNSECKNPCIALSPCGINAECFTRNHIHSCACPSGYTGNPRELCRKVPEQPGCSRDRHCKDDEVCHNSDCKDPCNIANPCGSNAVCQTRNHRPHCTCLPGFKGNPSIKCTSDDQIPGGCKSNSDCPSTQACHNNLCRYPCDANPCGQNAECINSRHTASCRCRNGYEGDPERRCTPVGCTSNRDCKEDQECYSGQCVDPCRTSSNPCPSSAQCNVINHSAICMCPPGSTGIPLKGCASLPSCGFNSDCLDHEACLDRTCKNPCLGFSCSEDMVCQVQKHRPVCKCPDGYKKTLDGSCKLEGCTADGECPDRQICESGECRDPCKNCGNGAICENLKGHTLCMCPPGTTGNPMANCLPISGYCSSEVECQLSEACIGDRCQDPCVTVPPPCGTQSLCRVINHRTLCQCPDGYEGDPRERCLPVEPPIPDCRNDNDCPYNRVCDLRTQTCVDPCKSNPCAESATCYVTQHQVTCKCFEGYTGNPNIQCARSPEKSCSEICPPYLACLNGECVDPCNCAPNAHCEVQNHRAICTCPDGYKGNPLVSCQPTLLEDPCENSPCGEGALCELDNGNPICFCPKHMTGNPFTRCIPEGDKCEEGVCGPNADCRIVNGVQKCFCLPEYTGRPPTVPCHIPKDSCDPSPCGQNTNCHVFNGILRCTCKDGYVGNPNTIRGCKTPINRCSPNPCGKGAQCNSVGPQVCSCRPGLIGDAYIECKRPPPICERTSCGQNADCFVEGYDIKCRCLDGYEGNPRVRCSPIPGNPCEPNPCGNYAECRVGPGDRPICSCSPHFIGDPNSPRGCRPKCITDSDCPLDKACVNALCVDPCAGTCGLDAICEVHQHKPVCSCPPNYIGDPLVECEEPDDDDPDDEISVRDDPCNPSPCLRGTQCRVQSGDAVCICLPGYFGDPTRGCKPECVVNSDCSRDKACIARKCQDPCPLSCGIGAECRVHNHNPVCFCPEGTEGTPSIRCTKVREPPRDRSPCHPNPCGPNSICRVTSDGNAYACTCSPGYYGNPCRPECTVNSDCRSDKSCQNQKCIDPCPGTCGTNAVCRVIMHQPICRCPDGLTGDPFTECFIKQQPPIVVQNPCNPSPCGNNAYCEVIGERPVCTCYAGYFGEPPGCRHECVINSDCDKYKACISNQCKDPCVGTCGTNALCDVVNHIPNCYCPSPLIGDPYITCVKVRTTPRPLTSPCEGNPCGPNAICKENGISYYCSCSPGFLGTPPNCRPECAVNSDCVQYLSCINFKCRDPCEGLCGINAECRVLNHNPICTCLPGYTGQPFTRCTSFTTIPPPPISDTREPITDPPIVVKPGGTSTTLPPIGEVVTATREPERDPCEYSPCGPNAECRVTSYDNYICECKPGYFGNPTPKQGCRPECVLNSHCGQIEICENQKCIKACPGRCSISAVCNVVNHRPVCSCPAGYIGDPYTRCYVEPMAITTTDSPQTPVTASPCKNTPCGKNAECIPQGLSYLCECLPDYFGDPYTECRPECTQNSDCRFYHACRNYKCVDLCPGLCGTNAVCKMVSHQPICTCLPNHYGDPYEICRVKVELTDPEPSVCEPNPCGPNSECTPRGYRPVCECLPGYFGEPPNCRPECIVNSDCSKHLACDNKRCADPCVDTCGRGASCKVENHRPECYCDDDLVGDPLEECKPEPRDPPDLCNPNPCGPYTICTVDNGRVKCSCLPGYPGRPETSCAPQCTVNSDCPLSSACINRLCVDPCIGACKPPAECIVREHHPRCRCPSGYSGNIVTGCYLAPDPCEACGINAECVDFYDGEKCKCLPKFFGDPYNECHPECIINQDCRRDQYCIGLKCVDPCPDRCGIDAVCRTHNHLASCACPPGYGGDALIRCTKPHDPPVEPECRVSGQCSDHLACIQQICQDPCPIFDICARRAECTVRNHHPICTCPAGYTGDPTIECLIIGCRANSECQPVEACINEQCRDPCEFQECGTNALCRAINHRAECYCPQGYKGDPYVRCYYPECVVDEECPTFLACINEKCRDPCNCGKGSDCRVYNHRPHCTCPPGLTGDPHVLCIPVEREEKGCLKDGDCPSKLACFEYVCDNPCHVIEPCAENAVCRVIDTLPYRSMTCVCLPGYEGDPKVRCRQRQRDPAGCTANDDCGSTELCLNGLCIDPCKVINPCSPNAECTVVNRKAQCSCPEGHTGDPRINCYTIDVELPECRLDTDCALDRACYSEKCADPCIVEDPCGIDAKCEPRNHRAVCYCPEGWFGSPTLRCYKAECNVDPDCPTDKACRDHKCVDPCTYEGNSCGISAQCRGVQHRAQCFCPPGTQGDARIACITVGCLSNDDCSDHEACDRINLVCLNVCDPTTCAPEANCVGRDHAPLCSCPPGFTGNAFISCFEPREPPVTIPPLKPQCESDSECSSGLVCINGLCKDPCAIDNPCIGQQICRVSTGIRRTVICSCPPNQILRDHGICEKPIVAIPECTVDPDCDDHEWCRNGVCSDVCFASPCGLNGICRGYNHRPECRCPPGLAGDPYTVCTRVSVVPPQPECEDNDDCPEQKACVNHICINPCTADPCARDSFCFVDDHVAVCRCPAGYTGDPKIECSPILPKVEIGCRVDINCPSDRACINTKCVEPCDCGPNAECTVLDHRPICKCEEGYQGDPKRGCYKVGCTRNEECPSDTMCYEKVCVNPCYIENPCAPLTAECYAEDHEARCRCLPGLEGDPYVKCYHVGCRQNSDCPTDLACSNRVCYNPCLHADICAPEAECYVFQHNPGCRCPPAKPYGDPRVKCEPKTPPRVPPPICRKDADCASQQACINSECLNPCYEIDPCHESAMCKVVDSLPVRTMICYCPDGFVINEEGVCTPLPIHIESGCASDSECQQETACINRMCLDPCNCGPNADCNVESHRAICTCQVGFQGLPETGCFPVGCASNFDCEDDKACIDGVCVNPCLVDDLCASNAECYATRHLAYCRCPPGYIGNGYDECLVMGCRTNSECEPERACINKQCINPCLDNPCARNAECSPLDHHAQCRCPPGTFGDPAIQCNPMIPEECYIDADCTSQHACLNNKCQNPCLVLDPCDETATCKVLDTLPVRTMVCVCPDGMVVETGGACVNLPPVRPSCESNSECPSNHACVNGFCKDPCICGKNANCGVVENHAVCSCFEGFEGDPLIECIELGCYTREDCETTHACMNGKCAPVCGPHNEPCGREAICQGIDHEAKCFCPPGSGGNPNTQCLAIGCRSDDNCPNNLACLNEKCYDPCDRNPCRPPAKCVADDHIATCPCPPGMNVTLDRGCQPRIIGCYADKECPSEMACVNAKCDYICAYEPCGINTECTLVDTYPLRTATCVCLPGYQGDARVKCDPVAVCPIEKGYQLDKEGRCACPLEKGFYVDENDYCQFCPIEKGFILTEDGRCICDPEKGYVLTNYGTCDCPLTHERNDDGVCVFVDLPPIPEGCTRNDECPKDKMCQNRKCIPPCSVIPCSENAICINSNHTAVCHCLSDYTGNPNEKDGCIPIRITRTEFPKSDMVVNCMKDGVGVDINMGSHNTGFDGLMYVKGYSKNEECRRILRQYDVSSTIAFKVKFGTCGLFHENGLARFVLVIQKHPKLVTYKAQAYHIKCTYSTGEKEISMGFNVSMLTTAGTIANTGPPPVCSMRITNQHGGSIDQAELGDLLYLRIDVEPSDIYGVFARNCVALTTDDLGDSMSYIVTDEHGCATDMKVFQEWDYNPSDKSIHAAFSAFKFPSSNSIRFNCNVRLCFGKCQPVNCNGFDAFGKRRRRRQIFEPDAEFIYEEEATLEGQLKEISVTSNAIVTFERVGERQIQEPLSSVDEVCVSKWGFIIALIITALLALVAVAVAVSCWLMAYRRRPKYRGPLPHPDNFPNPLFTTPEPLAEPTPDYLS